MKEFFGLWLLGTTAVIVALYLIRIILVIGAAFVTWDASVFKEAASQVGWATFRASVVLGVIIGFVLACVADEL